MRWPSPLPLRDLLSCSKTKGQLNKLLAVGLLCKFDGQVLRLTVSYDTNIQINGPHSQEEDFLINDHEEYDSLISLYVFHCILDGTFRNIVVESPDTDMLAILIGLVAHGHLGIQILGISYRKGQQVQKDWYYGESEEHWISEMSRSHCCTQFHWCLLGR